MFTGIIEELGSATLSGSKLHISCQTVLSDITPGASIAVNGVCLTAVEITADSFTADLAPETLARTNFPDLTLNEPVNLERPVTPTTRLSGHIVQGHVDATGVIRALTTLPEGNHELLVEVPEDLVPYLVYKGSITIDGISLTIASIEGRLVKVAIIPHTWTATNLHIRQAGSRVNIECDVLAKHVAKLLGRLDIPGHQSSVRTSD